MATKKLSEMTLEELETEKKKLEEISEYFAENPDLQSPERIKSDLDRIDNAIVFVEAATLFIEDNWSLYKNGNKADYAHYRVSLGEICVAVMSIIIAMDFEAGPNAISELYKQVFNLREDNKISALNPHDFSRVFA